MGRRRRTDEIAFGSDSFLDIVANIVGILIILIVIAGVRVSQMPALLPTSTGDTPSPGSASPEEVESAAPVMAPELRVADATPLLSPPPVAPQAPIAPPPEVLARLQQIKQQLASLHESRQSLESRLAETREQAQSVRRQAIASTADREAEQRQIEQGHRTIAALQSELETNQREVAGLHLELAETEAAQPPPQTLRHKVTPVGKVVDGPEVYFLLSQNRVAVVPVEELAEKFKEELQRKKQQFFRGQSRVGTVGPVQGFVMEYAVEREAISLMDELRMGTAVIKLGLSEWRLIPQATAVFENADEALLPR